MRVKKNKVAYYLLRRLPRTSTKAEYFEENPIRSYYVLLWRELGGEYCNPITIANTMRRILEFYFQVLGETKLDDQLELKVKDSREMAIFKSLLSWQNAGSHSVLEELFIEQNDVLTYKRLFKDIFCKLGHKAHYDMMSANVEGLEESDSTGNRAQGLQSIECSSPL